MAQTTKTETPLSQQIKEALYDETQGIVDLLVKLYAMVQWAAMDEGGDEVITVELIHNVAREKLKLCSMMIDDLRKGKWEEVAEHDGSTGYDTKNVAIELFSKKQAQNVLTSLTERQENVAQSDDKNPALLADILKQMAPFKFDPDMARNAAEQAIATYDDEDKALNSTLTPEPLF